MKVKLYDWKIDDYLKTPEERAFFLEAALEDAIKEIPRVASVVGYASLTRGLVPVQLIPEKYRKMFQIS